MSLRRKINLALLLGLTLTLFIYAMVDISISQSNLRAQAEVDSQNTARRLGVTLADPMWNFNVPNAKSVAVAELGSNDLVGVKVFDNEDNTLFELHWDYASNQAKDGSYPENFLFQKNQTIKFNDQGEDFDAGRIQLTYSSQTIDDAFSAAIKRSLVQMIILDVLILVLMGFLVHKLVLTPLGVITNRVNDIAQGHGDLTKRVDFSSSDELGELTQGINAFITDVHKIITDISDVAHRLDKTSETGQDNTNELNQQVTHLDEQVTQIVSAVHDLNESSKDVALQASESANVSKQSNLLAEEGMREVNNANEMTQELASSIQESTDKTVHLEEYSQSISTVIEVIKGIAEQTNLLALNAAIEAARAGEQGRGFAVVADEVRTLAQRTQESTGQITEIIAQLQQQSSNTLQVMKDGLEKSQSNVETVAQVGTTFDKIRSAIEQASQGAAEIARDAEDQNTTLSSIEKNVDLIKSANNQTLEIARRSANTNDEIVNMSHTVSGFVEKFKI